MNFYQVLGDEGGEVAQPQRTATSSKPSGSSTSKPQGQRQYDNNRGQGRQGGVRPPRERGSDPVNPEKKGRPPRRDHERKPVKSEERLERHSGTGRTFENKKGGHGKANWGAPEKEDETVQPQTTQPEPEPEPVETEEEKQKREELEKKREEERIKEEKQMTLEDYLKSKKSVSLTLPAPRAPNEGITEVDKKKWAPLPVEAEAPKTTTATTSASKEEVKSGNEHLNVLGEFFNVRIKDDAHSRRRQQRFDAERREKDERVKPVVQQTGASLLAEDPRVKQTGQKKKSKGKVPTKEDFPSLKA